MVARRCSIAVFIPAAQHRIHNDFKWLVLPRAMSTNRIYKQTNGRKITKRTADKGDITGWRRGEIFRDFFLREPDCAPTLIPLFERKLFGALRRSPLIYWRNMSASMRNTFRTRSTTFSTILCQQVYSRGAFIRLCRDEMKTHLGTSAHAPSCQNWYRIEYFVSLVFLVIQTNEYIKHIRSGHWNVILS